MHLDKKNTMKINRDLIRNLLKNKLFEQSTSAEIDEAGRAKYTEKDLIDSACQYKTMGEFIQKDRNKYQAARNRDILLKIRSKCKYKFVGNLMQRMVYMYIWETNIHAVYFGLTCDEDRRYEEHVGELDDVEVSPSCKKGSNSAVRDFIKEHGTFDRYLPITDGYINAILAAAGEMCLIDHYRNDEEWKDKIIVVNRSKGGELGGRCSVNFGKLLKDSEKILSHSFESSEEYRQKFPKDFEYWTKTSQRKKMMNQKLNKRFFEDAPYSIGELVSLIQNYNNETQFEQNHPRAFKSAKRNKIVDVAFPKNKVFKNIKTNQTYDNLKGVVEDLGVDFEDALNVFKRNQGLIKYNIELVDTNSINESLNLKKLIKTFLKEETSSDDLRKGIDIAVKALIQDYPFIVGWEYSNDPERWSYKIYINLKVDHSKSMEFFNLKPHPRFGKFIKDSIINKDTLVYPFSFMNYEDEEFDTNVYLDIKDNLSEIYEDMIPKKFKMERGNSVFNQDSPKELTVDNYIYVK